MIPGIIELSSKTIYGFTSRNVPIYRFKPLNTALSDYLVGCSHKDKSRNMLGLVQKADTVRTNLIRLIGPCGDIEAEREALLLQYSSNEWKKFDKKTIAYPRVGERVFLNGVTFNIDPVGCRDIDDVITIGDDGYIYITIADVGSWMNENPSILEKASTIGQTLYEEGRVVSPLLPNEEQYSLLPNQERLGIALKFKWTGSEIIETSFQKVNLVNNRSFTYEEAQTCQYASILKEIASYLGNKELTDSHDWIEQLMIFYNCEAAKLLVDKKQGILRSQEQNENLNTYKILGILENKSANYIPASNPQPHYGLNKDKYCHATSPIRRFADIINQMVLCDYKIIDIAFDTLNRLQKQAKKYDRDSFFLNKLLTTVERTIEGIVLNDHRVWVPEWRRIVTCKNDKQPETKGILKYSLDMNQSTWKRRMVFKFVDTDYLEPQIRGSI